MATKQHERTLKMMENFISLHNEGHSIKEIAERYKLSPSVVYKNLGAIAEKVGVSRKDLLEKPIIADHSGRNFTPVKSINREDFDKSFTSLMEGVEELQSAIKKETENMEIVNNLMEEEMK